jgi:hypothetical protein
LQHGNDLVVHRTSFRHDRRSELETS